MTEPLTFSSDPVDSNRLYAGTMGLRSIPATRGALGSCVEVRVSVLFIFPHLVACSSGRRRGTYSSGEACGHHLDGV